MLRSHLCSLLSRVRPKRDCFRLKHGVRAADNAFMQNSGHCDKAGAGGYNETTFVQTADALKSNGLADLGYICQSTPPRSHCRHCHPVTFIKRDRRCVCW